jgi:hypothetical protein
VSGEHKVQKDLYAAVARKFFLFCSALAVIDASHSTLHRGFLIVSCHEVLALFLLVSQPHCHLSYLKGVLATGTTRNDYNIDDWRRPLSNPENNLLQLIIKAIVELTQ